MLIDDFHTILGRTIMYCQTIENDIKLIYSAMANGDMDDTFSMIQQEKWTLGKTVSELKKLDFSEGEKYLSNDDYKLLMNVAKKRNHWCHEAYIEFIYDENFQNGAEYRSECKKLKSDHDKLSNLYKTIENVRLQAMDDFGRNG